jgi:hypothetical protein
MDEFIIVLAGHNGVQCKYTPLQLWTDSDTEVRQQKRRESYCRPVLLALIESRYYGVL